MPFDENVPLWKVGERFANLRDTIADTGKHVGPAGREVDASRESQDDAAGFQPGAPLDPLQALEEVRLRGRPLFGSRSRPTRSFCALALGPHLALPSFHLPPPLSAPA